MGILSPYYYAISMNDDLNKLGLFVMTAIAGGLVFLVFVFSLKLFKSLAKQIIFGTIGCYVSFFMLIFIIAVLTGDFQETIKWYIPIMLIVGIPYTTPLVGVVCLGTFLIFGKRSQPEQN